MNTYYCSACGERHESITGACKRTLPNVVRLAVGDSFEVLEPPFVDLPPMSRLRCVCGNSSLGSLCGPCLFASTRRERVTPPTEWVWTGSMPDYSAGTLGTHTEAEVYVDAAGRMHANATIDLSPEGRLVELHTPLPQWSIAQGQRFIEQWVASQVNAWQVAINAAEALR